VLSDIKTLAFTRVHLDFGTKRQTKKSSANGMTSVTRRPAFRKPLHVVTVVGIEKSNEPIEQTALGRLGTHATTEVLNGLVNADERLHALVSTSYMSSEKLPVLH
jgi:hypothetical protein